jgi:hypothetical protein
MDVNSAFDTNVSTHIIIVNDSILTDKISFPFLFSFLNVGAGFALTKANLFPTEAARGGAQLVLVRKRAK